MISLAYLKSGTDVTDVTGRLLRAGSQRASGILPPPASVSAHAKQASKSQH
jgi:hypothetical protein